MLRPSVRLLALVIGGSLLGSCGTGMERPGRSEVVVVEEGQPILIGISTMLEGELGDVGRSLQNAAELAGNDVTIAGHNVRFVSADDACTEEGGAEAAERLVGEDGLVAVVGPSCSDAVIGAQPEYEDAGISHISQLSTNILTTQPEGREPYRTFFRTAFNDEIQGSEQARFAEETLGAGSAYIVYEAFRYGGAADTFRSRFQGEQVGDRGFESEDEFPEIAEEILRQDPDLVYFSGFTPTGVPFVKELRSAGYEGPFLAGDAMYDPGMIEGLGELAEEDVYVTLPSPPLQGPVFEDFRTRYEDAYGEDPTATSFTAESYDASTAILTALEEVARETQQGGVEVDLNQLNQAIRSVSFEGASGPIRFDENGDRVADELEPVTVYVVRDGRFTAFSESR